MRLYDRIVREQSVKFSGFVEDGTDELVSTDYLRRKIETTLPAAARVDISNVASYHEEHHRAHGRLLSFPDAPVVRPPFPDLWIEWTEPASPQTQSGMLVWGDEEEAAMWLYLIAEPRIPVQVVAIGTYIYDRNTGEYVDNTAWWDISNASRWAGGKSSLPDDEFANRVAVSAISVVVTAIAFMHCKNVVVTDAPDTRTRQQRRYDERKGTKPVQFKTLAIEPMKQVLKAEGGIDRHGLKRAMHICRGHFAVYTEEKPLFGKYSGTFWKPAHVRGSADVGMVGKDYKVKAPKGATV